MRVIKFILLLLFLAGWSPIQAAQPRPAPTAEATAGQAAEKEHGVPQKAQEIARPFGFPITNSMLVSWVVALGLIIFARRAMRNATEIPSGAQNRWEWMVESLRDFLEGIIGQDLVKKTFWFFASVFIFILFSNWTGLIPGFGTIYTRESASNAWEPLLRAANADLNMTLAMSLVFFVCWTVWAVQAHGPIGFLLHLFAPPKGDMAGPLKFLMIFVFLAVGCLEIVSILFRPVSLSFRLYGNIFAGDNMLETMSKLVPGLGWLLPIPFYFMEVLVGFVQALVFMLLTAVFTMLICQEEEGHAKAQH